MHIQPLFDQADPSLLMVQIFYFMRRGFFSGNLSNRNPPKNCNIITVAFCFSKILTYIVNELHSLIFIEFSAMQFIDFIVYYSLRNYYLELLTDRAYGSVDDLFDLQPEAFGRFIPVSPTFRNSYSCYSHFVKFRTTYLYSIVCFRLILLLLS